MSREADDRSGGIDETPPHEFFARMLEEERLFDEIVPELVLWGLKHAEAINGEASAKD